MKNYVLAAAIIISTFIYVLGNRYSVIGNTNLFGTIKHDKLTGNVYYLTQKNNEVVWILADKYFKED